MQMTNPGNNTPKVPFNGNQGNGNPGVKMPSAQNSVKSGMSSNTGGGDNAGMSKNMLWLLLVVIVVLLGAVFIARRAEAPASTATTTDETTGTTTDTVSDTISNTVSGMVYGTASTVIPSEETKFTSIVISRTPDLTANVRVMAGGSVVSEFSVKLQERSNITPVLEYIKKNLGSSLSYDGILALVKFSN